MGKREVHLLIGPPAVGKSTFAKMLLTDHPELVFISSDGVREILYGEESCDGNPREVFDHVYHELQSALAQEKSVIYEATNLDPGHRQRLLARLRRWGATSIIGHCFDVPLSLCLYRNQQRSRVVDRVKLCEMHEQWKKTQPTENEDFDQLFWHHSSLSWWGERNDIAA